MKDIGCLEDIITDTMSPEHKRVFNPYTARTQVNTFHSDKQEETPGQQIKGNSAGTNMADEAAP